MTKDKVYTVVVDDQKIKLSDPVVTGRQLLDAAGKRPAEEFILYQHLTSGQLESIRLDEVVDLCLHGLERFMVFEGSASYFFMLEGRRFEWGAPVITGMTLKMLAEADPTNKEVWLEVRGGEPDRLIANLDQVELDAPGLERFYLADCEITVIVNGRPKEVATHVLTFSEIVKLAFPDAQGAPNTIYTVVYKKGPKENPQGSLVEGQEIYIKNRMIINVTNTDKS